MIPFNINTDWSKINISIIGGGISGLSAAKLAKYVGANVFISESQEEPLYVKEIKKYPNEIGCHSNKIYDSDFIIISPGVPITNPIVSACRKKNINIYSEIEFASWFTSSMIIALTGSNGKTTTANLLHAMCLCDDKNSLLGGNVGIPFSDNVLLELKMNIKSPIHVLEISSFQLEHIESFSPNVAGLLNISLDHLDRYNNIEDYANEKLKIAKNIKKKNSIIFNADDEILLNVFKNNQYATSFSSKKHSKSYFRLDTDSIYSLNGTLKLLELNETKLKGRHNLQNILAAATMAHHSNISDTSIRNAIINFSPIPHRIEWVGEIKGIEFFNDSKATNLAATEAAILSFKKNIILILGGRDKCNSDFSILKSVITKRVKFIISYGEDGGKIMRQLSKSINVKYIKKFKDAVLHAYKIAVNNDKILLSPGCSSYDQFLNFESRGHNFKNIIKEIELDY